VTNAFGRWRFPVDGTIEIVRLPRSMRLRPPAGGAGWELTARGPLVVETKRATERGTVSVRIFRNTPCFEIRLDPAGPGDGIRVEFPAAAAGERSRLLTDRGAMDESVLQAVVDSAEGWAVVEGDGFSLAAWPLAENQALHLRRDGTTAWLLSGGSPLGFALVGPDGESVVKWRRESWTSRARTAR
jgi:hypothetical protein